MRLLIYVLLTLVVTPAFGMAPRRPIIPQNPPPQNTPPSQGTSDPVHYENMFRQLAGNYGVTSFIANSIVFNVRNFFWGSTVGVCYFRGRTNQVDLNASSWNRGSDAFKELLVFHELGHCLLGRGHTNTHHSDGRPESVMRAWLFSSTTYLRHRDQYLKELFTANARESTTELLTSTHQGPCTGWGH